MQNNFDKPERLTGNQNKETIVKICSQAFFQDPLVTYFFQDENRRAHQLQKFFSFLYKWVMKEGEIYAYPENNPAGVCLLLPSSKYHPSFFQSVVNGAFGLVFSMKREELKRSDKVNKQMIKLHNKICPEVHQYLQVLAVSPESQGKGIGKALLTFITEQADKNQLPVYLETLVESNARIYEKHGFRVEEISSIPDTNLNIYSMLRKPSSVPMDYPLA